jgi:hypothetical protein
MRKSLRTFGLFMVLISIIVPYLMHYVLIPSLYEQFFIIVFGYLMTLFLPGLVIDVILEQIGEGIDCGGLPSGGYLIGYIERSLIFLSILITHYDSTLSYTSVLSFLSVIVAGKAIFRYSSRETNDRACADWYIMGTFLSITMALALTWGIFRFLLIG